MLSPGVVRGMPNIHHLSDREMPSFATMTNSISWPSGIMATAGGESWGSDASSQLRQTFMISSRSLLLDGKLLAGKVVILRSARCKSRSKTWNTNTFFPSAFLAFNILSDHGLMKSFSVSSTMFLFSRGSKSVKCHVFKIVMSGPSLTVDPGP